MDERNGVRFGRLLFAAGLLLVVAAAFAVSVFIASEQGEEIVTLRTFDTEGSVVRTRLWIVDAGGTAWLRSGVPGSGWLRRVEREPIVEVERNGSLGRFRAVPVRDPTTRDRIHALMREKYGLADRWVSLIRDARESVAIRLDAVEVASPGAIGSADARR